MKNDTARFVPSRGRGLSLTGPEGRLELAFLGVGAAFSTTMFQSNLFAIKGRTHVMIDLGTKASTALNAAGLDILAVENLVATHSHADHVGGIEEWCLKARYGAPGIRGCSVGEYKPRLVTTEQYAAILWDATLRGGLAHAKRPEGGSKKMSLSDYVELVICEPLRGYGRPVFHAIIGAGADAIDLKLMRTNHVPSGPFDSGDAFYSMGVLIDDRVFVSGDTMFDGDLIEEFSASADAVFHDCQEMSGGVHASYDELAALPLRLKEKMFLYHLSDGIRTARDPSADGFAGFAVDYREGVYDFS